MLKKEFYKILLQYCKDETLIDQLWEEIELNYNSEDRHYHTMEHLETMYDEMKMIDKKLIDTEVFVLAILFHDVIYLSTSNTNEEDSAAFAKERLNKVNYPSSRTSKVIDFILATQHHLKSDDSDQNFFIDVDLSVLGKNWKIYSEYIDQIRKEYSNYPDLVYKPGRIKVLQQFLNMHHIYKTSYFQLKYEKQARINLRKEMNLL